MPRKTIFFKRSKLFSHTSIYIRFESEEDLSYMHILEHILIHKMKRDNIIVIDGCSNRNFIKIIISEKTPLENLCIDKYLNNISDNDIQLADSEIHQELALQKYDVSQLLSLIRQKPLEEKLKISLDNLNDWLVSI
ncbi:hypothetical protein, partial [Staphylococcus lutrae]